MDEITKYMQGEGVIQQNTYDVHLCFIITLHLSYIAIKILAVVRQLETCVTTDANVCHSGKTQQEK